MIINGKLIASHIRKELKLRIDKLNITPGLGIIIVGDCINSHTYVRMKKRACNEVGIKNYDTYLPTNVTESTLITEVNKMNENNDIHAILVQLPLPNHINKYNVLSSIYSHKDVDGFNPINVGKLQLGIPASIPCTPLGCIELLKRYNITIAGKKAVVVGKSNIVGMPMMMLLLKEQATVCICHSKTHNLAEETKTADILIVAVGKPNLITEDMVKPGAIVIDVGINSVDCSVSKKGYKLVGDVDYENVFNKCGGITPVPGGVGPMTIAMLLKNCVDKID